MRRADRAAEAAELKRMGLNGLQIAERMGISRSYACELLNDPEGHKIRARKDSYRGKCRCGARTDGSNGRPGQPDLCLRCWNNRNAERNARIFEAWKRGETGREIALREGLDEQSVHALVDWHRRHGGVPIPRHRRPNRELWPFIERRLSEGGTFREIAVESNTTVENIRFTVRTMRQAGRLAA